MSVSVPAVPTVPAVATVPMVPPMLENHCRSVSDTCAVGSLAREIYRALAGRCALPDYSDLRPARRAKNTTLTSAATALHVWPARVGELELGRRRDDAFADRYRQWLSAA